MAVQQKQVRLTGSSKPVVAPVSIVSEWVDVHEAPEVQDGNPTINPGALASSSLSILLLQGCCTTLQVRLKYRTSVAVTVEPVIQVFGCTAGGSYQRLLNGDGQHQLTLDVDATNDVVDGTWSYSQPVEVDVDGCDSALVTVMTALAQGAQNDAVIQARPK